MIEIGRNKNTALIRLTDGNSMFYSFKDGDFVRPFLFNCKAPILKQIIEAIELFEQDDTIESWVDGVITRRGE